MNRGDFRGNKHNPRAPPIYGNLYSLMYKLQRGGGAEGFTKASSPFFIILCMPLVSPQNMLKLGRGVSRVRSNIIVSYYDI